MKSSCSCTRFISTRQKKLGDGAAQQERARTSLPRCDPARWQSAQKYGTWTHEHVVSDRTMQSTGSLSGAWTAWLERLPDLRPSPAAPKSSTPALETILQKPLNGGILMWFQVKSLLRNGPTLTPYLVTRSLTPRLSPHSRPSRPRTRDKWLGGTHGGTVPSYQWSLL